MTTNRKQTYIFFGLIIHEHIVHSLEHVSVASVGGGGTFVCEFRASAASLNCSWRSEGWLQAPSDFFLISGV